jgi:hypothetical protein
MTYPFRTVEYFTLENYSVNFLVCGNVKQYGSSLKVEVPSSRLLKGTVSREIAFYLNVYKFKSVLSLRPLMVFKFIYFVVL